MQFTYHDTSAIRTSYLNQIREFVKDYGHLFPFRLVSFSIHWNTQVTNIHVWGVTTQVSDYDWDQLDIVDLEYIMQNVFELAMNAYDNKTTES